MGVNVRQLHESCAISVRRREPIYERCRNANASAAQAPIIFARRNRHGAPCTARRLTANHILLPYPSAVRPRQHPVLIAVLLHGQWRCASRARKRGVDASVCDLDRWATVLEEPTRRRGGYTSRLGLGFKLRSEARKGAPLLVRIW